MLEQVVITFISSYLQLVLFLSSWQVASLRLVPSNAHYNYICDIIIYCSITKSAYNTNTIRTNTGNGGLGTRLIIHDSHHLIQLSLTLSYPMNDFI